MTIDRYCLNLTGEYRVASEILKRNVFATVTYGNKKGADVYAIGPNRRAIVVEVKSSNDLRFVTKFYQKYKSLSDPHPDFWVLYSAKKNEGEFLDRFFILTHKELAKVQKDRNYKGPMRASYEKCAEDFAKGVDNVLVNHVIEHEDRWDKIIKACGV